MKTLILAALTLIHVAGPANIQAPADLYGYCIPSGYQGISDVMLQWGHVDSIGYRVYRGDTPGGPYTLYNFRQLDKFTRFTDRHLSQGATYYYVVTAMDADGTESGYSNEAAVTVK